MSDVSIILKLQVIDTQTRWPWVLGVWATLGPCSWKLVSKLTVSRLGRITVTVSWWRFDGGHGFFVLKATSGFETKSCDGWKGIWGMLTNHFLWRPLVTFYLWDGTLLYVFAVNLNFLLQVGRYVCFHQELGKIWSLVIPLPSPHLPCC